MFPHPHRDFLRSAALCACAGLVAVLCACSDNPAEPVNPPVLAPIGSKNVLQGEQLLFGVSAQASGGSWPALSASPLPSGATFTDHLDGTGTFDWTPSLSQVGNHSVVFRAGVGGLTDSEVVLIQVLSQPPPPPRDSVFITSDTVFAGDTAVLELILSNPDSAVAGLNIWLRSSPDILYDTAEAVSPRFPVTSMTWSSQRHDSVHVLSILMVDFTVPLDYVPPGSGPLFRLRFVVPSTQTPGIYTVDTTSYFVPRGLDISYRSGVSVPAVGFVPGQIVVQ